MEPILPPQSAARPSWWRRRWVQVLLVLALLLAIYLASAYPVARRSLYRRNQSALYQMALRAAQSDPRVTKAFGSPVQGGNIADMIVSTTDSAEHWHMTLPLSGPNGAGTLHIDAKRNGGNLQFNMLAVEVKDKPVRIDLKP